MYDITNIYTESDVEQKILYKLLTATNPLGLEYDDSDILTKPDIRKIEIDKGRNKKLYYPDYVVIVEGLPCLVIEAKAPGTNLDEASREARLYATEINSNYKKNVNPCSKIIVSDGIIINGYDWDNDTPFVSISVEEINPANVDFDNFISNFSKKSINIQAEDMFKLIKKAATYVKPVQMLGGKSVVNQTVGQNSFGSNVSLEYKYLFNPDTIKDREEIARNAYVESKRKLSHVAPIDKMIRASVPNSIVNAKEVKDTSRPIEIIDEIKDINKVKNEMCLLIGNVGSGKSTFTDYLREVALPSSLVMSTEWININLNKAPLTREQIYKWVVSEIIKSIKSKNKKTDFDHIDTIMKIYFRELSILRKGRMSLYENGSDKYVDILYKEIERLQEDGNVTLNSIIDYVYSGPNKLLVIVLDNCDKRSREDQLLMFEVATWLKDSFPCMIFLPLRDTTYDQFCNEPPLDTVIKDLVFRIDPPLLERVIYKRLNYALREISCSDDSFHYFLPNNAKVKCNREDVGEYIRCIVASLFQDKLFSRIITGLAGRNIRKGLEIFLDFCKSGHISDDEIFKIRQSKGDYTLPSYLISRIMFKGNRKYYDDEESNVKNLFHSLGDDSLPDPFVRISILQWLRLMHREYGPNRTKGFHKVGLLLKTLQQLGHSKKRVSFELKELADANCVINESRIDHISEDDLISIAPAGFVHLDLLKNINYLSAVSESCLFRENQVAKIIADNITGKGAHKAESKQSHISNSKALIDYMCSYLDEYFTASKLVFSGELAANIVGLKEIKTHIDNKAETDPQYQKINNYEDDYPPGTEVLAQIVSLQDYGFFVEFDLGCTGLIHKSAFPDQYSDILNVAEEGDWVGAKITCYRADHNRFNLALVEPLHD